VTENTVTPALERAAEAAHYAQGFDDWGVANETEIAWSTEIALPTVSAALNLEVIAQAVADVRHPTYWNKTGWATDYDRKIAASVRTAILGDNQ
jgi:hypothetical protein